MPQVFRRRCSGLREIDEHAKLDAHASTAVSSAFGCGRSMRSRARSARRADLSSSSSVIAAAPLRRKHGAGA